MRSYATISPRFWTGDTGRALRRLGSDCQVLALYLMTAPSSTMTGLYYLPIPTMAHELGRGFGGASEDLRRVCNTGFAHYDADEEVVFVPEMARFQIGDTLSPKDNRRKGARSALEPYLKSRLLPLFLERYGVAYGLEIVSGITEKPRQIVRGSEGASEPLRSQDQDQDQDLEHPPADAGAREGRPPGVPVDDKLEERRKAARSRRKLAADLYRDHSAAVARLKADGIDAAAFGLGATVDPDLAARISDAIDAGQSLDQVADACHHVLSVGEAEARASGSLRYFCGSLWSDKSFRVALGLSTETADRAKYRAPTKPGRPRKFTPDELLAQAAELEEAERLAAGGGK